MGNSAANQTNGHDTDITFYSLSDIMLSNNREGCQKLRDVIEAKKIDVSKFKDEHEETLLHLAAKLSYPKIMEVLLDNGADIEARNRDGRTALHIASQCIHCFDTKLLLSRGANVNAVDKYMNTPLHYAVIHGSLGLKLAKLLLDYGANVDAKNRANKTPKQFCNRDPYVLKFLHEYQQKHIAETIMTAGDNAAVNERLPFEWEI